MVAVGSYNDLPRWCLVMHVAIPAVCITSTVAAPSCITRGKTAIEAPPTIFIMIMMIAFDSFEVVIWITHEIHWIVVIVHISCPVAVLWWIRNHLPTLPPPNSVFVVVTVGTDHSIKSISTIAYSIKMPIKLIMKIPPLTYLGRNFVSRCCFIVVWGIVLIVVWRAVLIVVWGVVLDDVIKW